MARLLIDVHGLPSHWETNDVGGDYRRALALAPAVNAAKRGGAVLIPGLSAERWNWLV